MEPPHRDRAADEIAPLIDQGRVLRRDVRRQRNRAKLAQVSARMLAYLVARSRRRGPQRRPGGATGSG
jgi:hypothetical protein